MVRSLNRPRFAYPHSSLPTRLCGAESVGIEHLERRLPMLLHESRAVREDEREGIRVRAALVSVPETFD